MLTSILPVFKRLLPLVALLGIVIFLFFQTPRKTSLQTETVARKDISLVITASGKLQTKDQVSLHFLTPARLVWLGVKEGDTVWPGQALASLDKAKIEATFRQAQQDFIAAQAEVEKVYDETKRKVDESFEEKIKRTAAEAKQNKAFDNMKKAEADLRDSTLISPIPGTVTKILMRLGENLGVTDTIEIVDLTSPQFEALVDEVDYGKIRIDQKVKVIFDAFPDEEFEGQILFIKKATEQTASGGVAVPVKIELRFDPRFVSGLSGEAKFIIEERENVLVVPRRAVKKENGEAFVQVLKDGQVVKQKVKLGLQTDKEAEILEGLGENDRIIVEGPAK